MNWFLVNLLITITVELCMTRYVVAQFWPKGPSLQRVLFANLTSNPIAQIIFSLFSVNMWVIEIGVVIYESLFYIRNRRDIWKALAVSFFLNAASLCFGFLIQSIFMRL
jgi:hypothetical protein